MKWLRPRRLCPGAALGLLCWAVPGAGQSPEPFSTLEIFVGGSAPVEMGELGTYWQADPGIAVRLSTPFHIGIAAAALHTSHFDSLNDAEQPDFRMRSASLEWNLARRVTRPISAFAGVRAGAAAMNFPPVEPRRDNTDENEFLAGVQAGLHLQIAGAVGATLIASHRHVFTRLPLRLTELILGLSYTVTTPDIIRSVLE